MDGTVYDSLRSQPLRGATVWIEGTLFTATADAAGRFELTNVPVGEHVLTFSSAALDSANVGPFARALTVVAGETVTTKLGTPSFEWFWKRMCPSNVRPTADSGIVFGVLRNADGNGAVGEGRTTLSWYDLTNSSKVFRVNELKAEVHSDSTGAFYACGVPTEVAVTAQALGKQVASGTVDVVVSDLKVRRIDLRLSRDNVASSRMRGTSIVRGDVRDVNGLPVAEAIVSVPAADTSVRTNADGSFVIANMPAGTHGVQVRKIGFAVATKIVDVTPGNSSDVNIVISDATTLATVNVRAARTTSYFEQEFLNRRKLRIGLSIDFEKSLGFSTPLNALTNLPRVELRYNRDQVTVLIRNAGKTCPARIYLDGRLSDSEEMRNYPVDNIRYVEVFNSPYFLPAQFLGSSINPCGAVAYWSKFKW